MTDPSDPLTDGTSADHSRSGDDVAEAIEVAERGSSVQDVHDNPEDTRTGEAPVEQVRGDPAMTEGQVVDGPGESGGDTGSSGPATGSSGAAQSVTGARPVDR